MAAASILKRVKTDWLRGAVHVLLSAALAYFLDIGITRLGERSLPETRPTFERSIFNALQSYQRFVLFVGHSELIPRAVSLVVISDANERRFADPCSQRELVAALLNALKDSSVKVIVIDKVYLPTLDCQLPNNPENPTNQLQHAVYELSKVKPVVLAVGADGDHLLESLEFQNGGHLTLGVANRAEDYREVPLVWNLFAREARSITDQPQPFRSLPYAAALAAQPIDQQSDKILTGIESGRRPLTIFIPANVPNEKNPRMLAAFSVGHVICGEDKLLHVPALQSCAQKGSQFRYQRTFLTDIVVIGEESQKFKDVHSTVIGPVPGVVLVANYIDSILDPNRLFHAAPRIVNVALGFLVYAALQWAFANKKKWRETIKWSFCTLSISFLLIISVFSFWRIYLEPITMSISSFAVAFCAPLWERWIRSAPGQPSPEERHET